MSKNLSYEYKPSYFQLFPKVIRNKIDVIKTILFVCRIIIAEKSDIRADGITIEIQKNSRVFIKASDNYIYSLAFPFTLLFENDQPKITYKSQLIDSKIISIVEYLANEIGETNVFNKIIDIDIPIEYGNDDFTLAFDAYFYLLSFDEGYIRYETDEERANEEFHPLHHVDICYHNNSTYKLGLYNKISLQSFQELINVKKQCWYVKKK